MNQSPMFGDDGKVLRDAGMQQAIEHAEQETPNWATMALDMVKAFVLEYPHLEFMAEDIREWAHNHKGLPESPSKRAWGGILAKASHQDLIIKVRIGQVKNPTAHRANANVWRAKQ